MQKYISKSGLVQKLGKDKISMAFKLLLASDSADIDRGKADNIMADIVENLRKIHNAQQR